MIRYFAVLLALLVGCVPSKPASVDSTIDDGSPDVSVTHEPEHFGTQGAVITPLSYLQPPGVAGRKIIVSEDGGTWIAVDANLGGSASAYYGVDGGGIRIVEAGIEIYPVCDSGVFGHGTGGGWVCTASGVSGVSATAPLYVSGGDSPNVSITPGTDNYPLITNGSGVVGFAALPLNGAGVTGSLPLANQAGPTGTGLAGVTSGAFTSAAIAGTPGQALVYNGSSVPAAVTVTGDTLVSSSGVTTTNCLDTSVCGNSTTGTLTASATATAPGLAQASTTGATPVAMTIAPQASTNANGNGGMGVINLPNPTGTGNYGEVLIEQGGTPMFAFGKATNPIYAGHTFAWADQSTLGATNYAFDSVSGAYFAVNVPSGTLYLQVSSNNDVAVTSTQLYTSANYNLSIGGASINGGGTSVLGIANTSTPPTSACTGGTCLDSVASTGLVATSANFDVDTVQAVTSGTHASQVLNNLAYSCQASSSTGTSAVCNTIAVPTGATCHLSYIATGRCTDALGLCNTSGDGSSVVYTVTGLGVKNISGTLSSLTGTGTATTATDPGVSVATCAVSGSGTDVVITCGDTGNAQTMDWRIEANLHCG